MERARDEADRRVVLADISDEGLRLLASLDAPIRAAMRKTLAHMPRKDLETLSELLEQARRGE